MARKKKGVNVLPQKVYVYWYEDRNDLYLSVGEKLEDCADVEGPRLVGTYELKELQQVDYQLNVITKPVAQ